MSSIPSLVVKAVIIPAKERFSPQLHEMTCDDKDAPPVARIERKPLQFVLVERCTHSAYGKS